MRKRKVIGSKARPRLSVYSSLKHIYAQIIDDEEGRTLVSASSLEKNLAKMKKGETAVKIGELIGQRAKATGILKVCFDRGEKRYHGRIKLLADSAREQGLQF